MTQGDPLSIILYIFNFSPLEEELRVSDPGLLTLFYADDAAFYGSAQKSSQLLNMLMGRGMDRGYFPETAKSLFIVDSPEQEEAAKKEVLGEREGFKNCRW